MKQEKQALRDEIEKLEENQSYIGDIVRKFKQKYLAPKKGLEYEKDLDQLIINIASDAWNDGLFIGKSGRNTPTIDQTRYLRKYRKIKENF